MTACVAGSLKLLTCSRLEPYWFKDPVPGTALPVGLMNNRQLRRHMRTERRAIPPAEHALRSSQLARHAGVSLFNRGAQTFACFLSADGEVDTRPLITRLLARGASVWLPCLGEPVLRFREYQPGMRMRTGDFGIREPALGPFRRATQIDVVLTPLVAFDCQGYRLGMGGGYYDRSLARRKRLARYRHPRIVGVAFDRQRVDSIDVQPWDVPLDAVVTETGLHTFTHLIP